MITLQDIKQNEAIRVLIRAGNRYLEAMGYTEHGPRHAGRWPYRDRDEERHA